MAWPAILRVLGISSIPFLELRLGIPMGIAAGLEPIAATLWAIAGNLTQVPFSIVLILVLRRTANRFRLVASWLALLERAALGKEDKVRRYGWIGLTLVVGIPLPGTGLWVGAALASIMRMSLAQTVFALSAGVVMAGVLVGLISAGAFGLFEAVDV